MKREDNLNIELLFHKLEIQTADKHSNPIKLRTYLMKEKYLIESGILFQEINRVYPLNQSIKSLILLLIQFHRFNIGVFKYESRGDNPLQKNKRKLIPDSLNPVNLEKLGVDPNYFGGETYTWENIDNLFKKFNSIEDGRTIIDDVLYKRKTSFNISKDRYRKYLIKTLNLTYDIALERSAKSFSHIKSRLIGRDFLRDQELVIYNDIKQEFLDYFGIQDQIYDIDDERIIICNVEFLTSIKDKLESAIENSLERTRTGPLRNYFDTLSKHLQNFSSKKNIEQVQTLIRIFDLITDEKELYLYLSRLAEKFYNQILGKFCRVFLSELIIRECLSRPEVRLFVLLNIPLKFFNYHSMREGIFQDFTKVSNVMDKLFEYIIFRQRDHRELKEFETSFFSYLNSYKIIVTILRDYDKEKKQKSRSREVSIEEIENIDSQYNNIIGTSGSTALSDEKESVDDNDEDDDSTELEQEHNNDINILEPPETYDEDKTIVHSRNRKVADPFKKEHRIREIEVDDIIYFKITDETDRKIIHLLMEGETEEYIGKQLKPPISKQAVSRRISKIKDKFEPEEITRKLLLSTF